jgi:poly-gamma-glutamate synthesis protein (capsule biosynthesis protein)
LKKLVLIVLILGGILLALSSVSVVPRPIEAGFRRIIPEIKSPAKIFMAGDIMLGRYVETLMNKFGEDYPFEKISNVYTDSDIVFGNLEGPISTNHYQTPDNVMVFSFKPETGSIIKRNGFNLVTLANNHTFDRADIGLNDSKFHLDEAGVDYFGHPKLVDDFLETKVNGHEIVFIGLHDTFLNDLDHDEAVRVVKEFKDKKKFVFVSIHWGSEYKPVSNKREQDFAHRLVDSGADVIIGHHPHVVQEIEEYNGSLIFYSLGNFIFDQYFSKETQEGLTLTMEITNRDLKFNLLPIDIIKSHYILQFLELHEDDVQL